VDLRIEGLCEEEPVIRRLMTVPCIGSVVAAAFVNPGTEGERAIAEAILGKINPSGKFTISFPLHVGQQPVFYNQVRGQHGTRYADLTQEPLSPFGHGLSYTTYRYSNARLASPTIARGQAAAVFVDVENAGSRAGDEIVQVYVSDVVTSVTWVARALQGFSRVHLAPGERKTVTVTLPWEAFQLVDAEGRRVVEPGEFQVLVGPSSREGDLLKATLRAE
jgi:beta-glucosidase